VIVEYIFVFKSFRYIASDQRPDMNDEQKIPDSTIEALARSIFRESTAYGFRQADYLRLVNFFLDITMENGKGRKNEKSSTDTPPFKTVKNQYTKMPLISHRIEIREFNKKQDLARMKEWLEDEMGRYFLLSRSDAKKMDLKQILANKSNLIGIIALPDHKPIGAVAFLDLDPVQKKAELRKLIGDKEMRGMGYAKEACDIWIQYGIHALGLKKIYLNTLNTNLHNIKLNEDLGFKVEGILRNEVYFDDDYHDILRMGLVRS